MARGFKRSGDGGWFADVDPRGVGRWRARRIERERRRRGMTGLPSGPFGPPPDLGGPLGAGDREPRSPLPPLPSLAAELEVPTAGR